MLPGDGSIAYSNDNNNILFLEKVIQAMHFPIQRTQTGLAIDLTFSNDTRYNILKGGHFHNRRH
jgi:hypothetical protein